MKIKKYYLSKSDNTRRMEKIKKVEKIIVTSSKYKNFSGLKNRNIIEMLKYKEEIEFSCHYIIGLSGEIINIIPEEEKAICTRINDIDEKSISIMLCINNEERLNKVQKDTLKTLLNKLLEKYDLTQKDIVTEYDINNSRLPKELVDEPIILYTLLNPKITRIKL